MKFPVISRQNIRVVLCSSEPCLKTLEEHSPKIWIDL